MLPDGALSIVRRSGIGEGDERTLQVRARRSEWLDSFRAYCPELGENLFADGKADYSWRAFARPEDVARAMARVVLGISYTNFKAAAGSREHGLKDPVLRSGLMAAYHKVWNDLLAAGDGTSVYDWKNKGGSFGLTGIEACRRWGHWWPPASRACKDCGEPNPAYPQAGPEKVFPAGYPKKKAAPRKPRRQASAKPALPPETSLFPETPPAAGSAGAMALADGTCSGSWTAPADGSTELSVPANGYQETAVCTACGTRQRLTMDGAAVWQHWADTEVIA